MKTIIGRLLPALLLLAAGAAHADGTKTCKVKESDGSVEVTVRVTDGEKGKCLVVFSNDTDRNVNVRYEIRDAATGRSLPGSKLVFANSETTQEHSFGCRIVAGNVTVGALSGEKCQ